LKEALQPLSDASGTGILEADWHRHFSLAESERRCLKAALEPDCKITQRLQKASKI
jgi:hypothetical protein